MKHCILWTRMEQRVGLKKSLKEAVKLMYMCSDQEPVKQRDDNKNEF
jgi:hypothetical protein